MEKLGLKEDFWSGKRVLLTGHTGFKGGWASLMLTMLGAKVHGLSLPPTEDSVFYKSVGIENRIAGSTYSDITSYQSCLDVMKEFKPDIILHMAAQALVRVSYSNPLETYMVNVIGVANLLEAARQVESVKVIVNVTTDKCYKNNEWLWPYRENEALGGHDPYSSSKACAEIISAAYRDSFFANNGVQLATARAGNVIGGGDWSKDRLIPDILRSLEANEIISIRSPSSIRPWQHVLEPVTGYILLAQKLGQNQGVFSEAWNFGPEENDCWSVGKIVTRVCDITQKGSWDTPVIDQPHEASLLKLDSSKAKARLGWMPRWNVSEALRKTIEWYRKSLSGDDMYEFSMMQIMEYQAGSEFNERE
jgi:CDP-glucose 4,6-dehydratase|tara:strand:+ start:222 stop:1310 length:1089 start_codon:yes stop_codon:yes gene_type:complete